MRVFVFFLLCFVKKNGWLDDKIPPFLSMMTLRIAGTIKNKAPCKEFTVHEVDHNEKL